MKISPKGINDLKDAADTALSLYERSVSADVDSFVSTMKRTWCSKASKSFAEEVHRCLESLIDDIAKFISNWNNVISSNVENYNKIENECVSFGGIEIKKADVISLLSTKEEFSDGFKGMEEDISPLKDAFEKIKSDFDKAIDSVDAAFSSNNMFDDNEQHQIQAISKEMKTKFAEEFAKLYKSFDERISEEHSTRNTMKEQNMENIRSMSSGK